jgi:hypothetical protein
MKSDNRTVAGVLYKNAHGVHHNILVPHCCYCGGTHRHLTADPESSWEIRYARLEWQHGCLIRVTAA